VILACSNSYLAQLHVLCYISPHSRVAAACSVSRSYTSWILRSTEWTTISCSSLHCVPQVTGRGLPRHPDMAAVVPVMRDCQTPLKGNVIFRITLVSHKLSKNSAASGDRGVSNNSARERDLCRVGWDPAFSFAFRRSISWLGYSSKMSSGIRPSCLRAAARCSRAHIGGCHTGISYLVLAQAESWTNEEWDRCIGDLIGQGNPPETIPNICFLQASLRLY